MPKIYVALRPEEFEGLRKLADRQERDPRSQASVIIRESLQRRGLIEDKPDRQPEKPQ